MSSIVCQRHGMAIETITSLFLTIQMMRFFLRTAFGDSTTFYTGSNGPVPFQGICQGNGGGPSLFLCISIVLVKVLHTNGHIAVFVAAISGVQTRFSGMLYVDDASLVNHALHPDEPVSQVIDRTQTCTNTWQGVLRASGGDLRATKCAWTLIDFIWIDGQWRYRSVGAMPATLKAKGPNDELIEVKRLEAWDATKVVGVHQAADGDMTAQFEVISDKITDMGISIRDNWVPRRMAWQGVRTMMWSGLSYPLPACTFSETQANRLTTDLYKLVLPTMGLVQSFPKVYRHAPKRFQGMDLPDFLTTGEAEKIARLLQHGDTPSITGQLQGISLEQAQLEIGIQTPLLEAPFDTYGFLLTSCWFKPLRKFVSQEGIVLRQENPITLPMQREGDEFVMERLIRYHQVQPVSHKNASAYTRRYHSWRRSHPPKPNEVLPIRRSSWK